MMLASEAILRSKEMRREVASAVDHAQRLQQAAHESVNENLIKKIAQTITVTVSVTMHSGTILKDMPLMPASLHNTVTYY